MINIVKGFRYGLPAYLNGTLHALDMHFLVVVKYLHSYQCPEYQKQKDENEYLEAIAATRAHLPRFLRDNALNASLQFGSSSSS